MISKDIDGIQCFYIVHDSKWGSVVLNLTVLLHGIKQMGTCESAISLRVLSEPAAKVVLPSGVTVTPV